MPSILPTPKPYAKIRGAYVAAGYDQVSLGKKIKRCESYMNLRLSGKKPWDEDDMYNIMDTLNIPYEEMHLYFPPRGIVPKVKACCRNAGAASSCDCTIASQHSRKETPKCHLTTACERPDYCHYGRYRTNSPGGRTVFSRASAT